MNGPVDSVVVPTVVPVFGVSVKVGAPMLLSISNRLALVRSTVPAAALPLPLVPVLEERSVPLTYTVISPSTLPMSALSFEVSHVFVRPDTEDGVIDVDAATSRCSDEMEDSLMNAATASSPCDAA